MRLQSHTIRDYAISILCAVLIGAVCITVYQVRATAHYVQSAVDEEKPKVKQTLTEIRDITRDTKIIVRASKDEWLSPEYERSRRAGFRIAEQGTVALARFTTDTLPRLDSLLDHSSDLVLNTDKNLNERLLPTANAAMQETVSLLKQYRITGEAMNAAILMFVQEGKVVMGDAHSLLSSPEYRSILSNLDHSTKSFAGLMDQSNQFMSHIEEAGREAPGMARDFHNITSGTSKTARIFAVIRLVAAFSPLAAVLANR